MKQGKKEKREVSEEDVRIARRGILIVVGITFGVPLVLWVISVLVLAVSGD